MSILRFALACGLALCLCGLAVAGEKAPSARQIDEWVEQLGARKFADREAATAALRKAGKPALAALERASRSDDPEVAQRARKLIAQIRVDALEREPLHALTPVNAARLEKLGGSAKTEAAVRRALAYLVRTQHADGSWRGADHEAKMAWVDPGLTGLALMALVARGNTHLQGTHKDSAKRAVRYLMKAQAADGLIGGKRGHYMYNHGVAAQALVELYGRTKSPLVKGAATRAVEYLIKARNPGMAWRYGERDGDNDVSVTIWCVSALAHARHAGIKPKGIDSALTDARKFVDSVTDSAFWVTGYKTRPPRGWQQPTSSRFMNPAMGVNTAASHSPNHTPTAIAGTVRVLTGVKSDDVKLRGAANVVMNALPEWNAGGGGRPSRIDFYYWYHGTQLASRMGGAYWTRWNQALKRALVANQVKDGALRGSWEPVGAWGFAGGRVYTTAIGALSLEAYYRYAPLALDGRAGGAEGAKQDGPAEHREEEDK